APPDHGCGAGTRSTRAADDEGEQVRELMSTCGSPRDRRTPHARATTPVRWAMPGGRIARVPLHEKPAPACSPHGHQHDRAHGERQPLTSETTTRPDH